MTPASFQWSTARQAVPSTTRTGAHDSNGQGATFVATSRPGSTFGVPSPAWWPDERCPMTMKDEYLRLMRGLIGGMAIAVALVCALIAAVAIAVS